MKKTAVRQQKKVCAILFSWLFVLFCVSLSHAGSGWVQRVSPGSWSSYVKKAHVNHPDLAKKVDSVVMKLKALHDEVKAAGCRMCNNAAGTLSNAKTEVEQMYYALGGRPQFGKNKVEGTFENFNNYENRMKWRFPRTPQGKAWYDRWTKIKAEFNAIKPEILSVVD